MMKKIFGNSLIIFLFISINISASSTKILIPMDDSQKNHLKSYGIAYYCLDKNIKVNWLLNYKGGSFCLNFNQEITKECDIRNVSYQIITNQEYKTIINYISKEDVNMEVVILEKKPKIAVYSPKTKQPWDDAVTLALTYSEIEYDIVYDEEVLSDLLNSYDWLHLHHEDFTGQYGKFYFAYKNASWYKQQQKDFEETAKKLGFNKVSDLKLAVAKKIKEFTIGGGYLFAMCSATDSYDIALSVSETDICHYMFDGDEIDENYQEKINYNETFAFENYNIYMNPNEYEFSSIDATKTRKVQKEIDYFTLFDFSAKWDQIPTMLCQNHTKTIKGFMGQTTSFKKEFIKSNVLIMGDNSKLNEAKYIHGKIGKGTWTFYGGHDPEDYQHKIGDPPTDLNLHPNSPGYRLILNNVLFPAAKKKKRRT